MDRNRIIDYTKYPLPRIRHHTAPHLYFNLPKLKKWFPNYPHVPDEINWCNFFENGNEPDNLDIGCGLGKFIIESALINPHKNFLGFEIRKKAVEWINNVIALENIPNARAFWFSVVNGFPFIRTGSIQNIYYFFPDPWVKKRHNKRRMMSFNLLKEFYRMLMHNGMVYLMTDVEEIDVCNVLNLEEFGKFSYCYVEEKDWEMNVKSNQEEFCLRKNLSVIRMVCWKNVY
jgi:tRNA (guanine-N7-)-methyltransferase